MEISTKETIDSMMYNGLQDLKKFIDRFKLQSAIIGWDEAAMFEKLPFFLRKSETSI